jgi:hypothetical protein
MGRTLASSSTSLSRYDLRQPDVVDKPTSCLGSGRASSVPAPASRAPPIPAAGLRVDLANDVENATAAQSLCQTTHPMRED